jgi:CheY-like chemotaxis protein
MQANILWIDDEIDSLKAQILFLEGKGYQMATMSNGHDGLEHIKNNPVDLVLLDESMPGMTGLEILTEIRAMNQLLPVVMVTKNEAENIMEEAIGSQITDYLIKPVNPNQVLLTLKKVLDRKALVSEKTTHAYQIEFRNLFMALNDNPNHEEWRELYKKLVYWELEMQKANSPEMMEVFNTQKAEANTEFCKFISKNYAKWIGGKDSPIMSHSLMKEKVLPKLEKGKPLFFVLIDNLRWDHWKAIEPTMAESFRIAEEDSFYAILPTSTQYARNAIFAGMMPKDIEKKFPTEWLNDDDEGGKNNSEKLFFENLLKSNGLADLKFSYTKITNHADGETLASNVMNLMHNDINIIVYNFVDMLSHARTEMEVLKELAGDEVAYRSIAQSWFNHSPLHDALKKVAEKNASVVIATDHGSVRVKSPEKVIGDRQTTSNIRYKHGKNLNYEASKQILAFKDPHEIGLPKPNFNSSFIFAMDDTFLCYPNNYNYYVNFYNNTFQHGGVSLEECIVPLIYLESKNNS